VPGSDPGDLVPPGRPRIGAFPKGYFDQLVARQSLTIEDWIRAASGLGIEGVELYPRFLASTDVGYLRTLRRIADDAGLELPMMCSSPDFVDPAPGAWAAAVHHMRECIDVMAELGRGREWRSVRVLSGQRWPDLDQRAAVDRVVTGIHEVLRYAGERDVQVVMENHYKDSLWTYPEFAQQSAVFLEIVDRIDSPWFGVNFDPSNALVVGDDPVELLDRVVDRVVTMHASDRSLAPGYSLTEFEAHRGLGYPQGLDHGITGQGLNDYPVIMERLAAHGFHGWISIEDGERQGEQGMADIAASATFLADLVARYWRDDLPGRDSLTGMM
jgi:sugar phosphate isomerase/epimerase